MGIERYMGMGQGEEDQEPTAEQLQQVEEINKLIQGINNRPLEAPEEADAKYREKLQKWADPLGLKVILSESEAPHPHTKGKLQYFVNVTLADWDRVNESFTKEFGDDEHKREPNSDWFTVFNEVQGIMRLK